MENPQQKSGIRKKNIWARPDFDRTEMTLEGEGEGGGGGSTVARLFFLGKIPMAFNSGLAISL